MSFLRGKTLRGTVGFAERLVLLRTQKGYSQSDLARAIWGEVTNSGGYTVARGRSRISAWESMKARPTKANLLHLAKVFDIAVEEFELGLMIDSGTSSDGVSFMPDGSVGLSIEKSVDAATALKILRILEGG